MKAQICVPVSKSTASDHEARTAYKIRGGGILLVKSIFHGKASYKDAIYPAIINKMNEVDVDGR